MPNRRRVPLTRRCGARPFADRADFDDAARGFLGTLPGGLVQGLQQQPVWSMQRYEFLQRAEAPNTVNPSLWRQAQLNNFNGLLHVTDS